MKSEKSLYSVVVTGILSPGSHETSRRSLPGCFRRPLSGPVQTRPVAPPGKGQGLILRTGKATAEVIQASPDLKSWPNTGRVRCDRRGRRDRLTDSGPDFGIGQFRIRGRTCLGLMLALAKDIARMDTRMHQGFWDKTQYRAWNCSARPWADWVRPIGRRVSQLVAPLQMKILISDPYIPQESIPAGFRGVSAGEPVEEADIVSLHCPLTGETRNLIGNKELRTMKKSAFLINTARGGIVNEEVLIAALQGGRDRGGGARYLQQGAPGRPATPLRGGKISPDSAHRRFDRRGLCPHGVEAAQNTLTVLEGKPPDKNSMANPELLETKG